MVRAPLEAFSSRIDPPSNPPSLPFSPSTSLHQRPPIRPHRILTHTFLYTMTIKISFWKKKPRASETVEISTFEDLLKFFDASKKRAKAKGKVKVDFDIGLDDDGGNDADAGVNADDGANNRDEDESIVRAHDSDCRPDGTDNVS